MMSSTIVRASTAELNDMPLSLKPNSANLGAGRIRMTSNGLESHQVDTEEAEYLHHGGKPYPARIYRPRGTGPFPAVVEAHGGAWCMGNYANNDAINRAVASGGVVVAALEFRNPPDAVYPGSVADINYGVRWLKSEADRFNTRPEFVGAMGTSSGGHLVVLAAMKPDDPAFAAVPLAGGDDFGAVPAYVVSLWPVICPLSRYREYQRRLEADPGNESIQRTLANHDTYWITEDAMADGSPVQILGRGEPVVTPDILYLQNPADSMHPHANLESFVAGYREAGGKVQLEYFDGPQYDHIRAEPSTPSSRQAFAKIIDFIHNQCAAAMAAADAG
jgi:acetyl esterase